MVVEAPGAAVQAVVEREEGVAVAKRAGVRVGAMVAVLQGVAAREEEKTEAAKRVEVVMAGKQVEMPVVVERVAAAAERG